MNIAVIFFISFGLAMDAFAVSFSCGMGNHQKASSVALKAAVSFGFFQGFMPVIGWFLGYSFRIIIEPVDHWIAFILLAAIGIHMIKEAGEQSCSIINLDNIKTLLTLSVATSIDALATGITFSVLEVNIFFPAVIIGVVTFITSYAGVFIGRYFGCHPKLQSRADFLGGTILIFIGLKILTEHIF